MKVYNNYPLYKINAFKVRVSTRFFAKVKREEDLNIIFSNPKLKKEKLFILGQGFNTLFTTNFKGLILKIEIKGINKIKESKNEVILEVGAGEDWIKLVDYTLDKKLFGLENLSLIPGSVGAAPVQNIAAYGQSFEDVFVSLSAYNIETGKTEKFTKNKCQFSYRDSFFKKNGKNNFIITKVRLRLIKIFKNEISYHSRYGSLEEELKKFSKPPYSAKDISYAVTRIRKRKFPDWKKLGTAGSFFLNPVITKKKLKKLQEVYPEIQYYPVDKLSYPKRNDPTFKHNNYVKIPAGWLFEELGWKGKRLGDVGTSSEQSLVVINYRNAKPKDILNFTKAMARDFKNNFNINLEPEVIII